ncbi:hypothetical protein B0T17DRAFT_616901 [Bombardia bombarda]|uniref:Uncharacterized protein n=1 Tax=Bombardia bombarda TaxID=252184 RepID=A0AA40C4F4_9PEZI|nr:hypothetical protein B0T17DRAFT_616901 [Bombardia bombarda]
MSSDNNNTSPDMARQQRRGSVTSTAALTNLFRTNSLSQNPATGFPSSLTSATLNEQRRRLSLTTLGLSGTSPTSSASFMRRGSMSTNADSIDENAVEEDDAVRSVPTTPFARRMSVGATQAMRGMRGGISPGNNGRPSSPSLRRSSTAAAAATSTSNNPPPLVSPTVGNYTWGKPPSSSSSSQQASTATQSRAGADMMCSPLSARSDQGFNWSEQLRSRAETTVTSGPRSSFSFASGMGSSPPRGNANGGGGGPPSAGSPHHDRARSVSDMPAPPAQAPRARAPQKPDHIQERILKGDFYMD